MPYGLLGNEAFPLKPFLMRHLLNEVSIQVLLNIVTEHSYSTNLQAKHIFSLVLAIARHSQKVFNYRFSRAPRVIENAFRIMTSRWGIPTRPFRGAQETVQKSVLACIALHNFLLKESAAVSANYTSPGKLLSQAFIRVNG